MNAPKLLLDDRIESPLVGGYYEDETGWWMVEEVHADGTVWLVDRDGGEWQTTVDRLPPLTYAD